MEQFFYNGILLYETGVTLTPINGRKSFSNKCKLFKDENGKFYLLSYNTIVCAYDKNKGFSRLWSGYSSTTTNHVNSFRRFCGLEGLNKKEWENLEVEKYA